MTLVICKPIVVTPGMDRRKVKVPPCYVAVLNTLVTIFAVTDQNEYKLHPELFNDCGLRAISRAELCNLGAKHRACGTITESQIDRVLRAFDRAGIIDRAYPYDAVKGKRQLFIRLRSDNVIEMIRRIDAIKKGKVTIAPPLPPSRGTTTQPQKLNKDGVFLRGGPCINADILLNISSTSSSASPVTRKSDRCSAVLTDFRNSTVPVPECPLAESAARFQSLVDDMECSFETMDEKQLARLKRLYTACSPRKRLTRALWDQYRGYREMHIGTNSPDYTCDLDSFLKWWPGILRNMRATQVSLAGGWEAVHYLQELPKLPQLFERMVEYETAAIESGYHAVPWSGLSLILTLVSYMRLGATEQVQQLVSQRRIELHRACFEAPSYFEHLRKTMPEFVTTAQLSKYDVAAIKRKAAKEYKFAVNLKTQMEMWTEKN